MALYSSHVACEKDGHASHLRHEIYRVVHGSLYDCHGIGIGIVQRNDVPLDVGCSLTCCWFDSGQGIKAELVTARMRIPLFCGRE